MSATFRLSKLLRSPEWSVADPRSQFAYGAVIAAGSFLVGSVAGVLLTLIGLVH